MPPELGQPGDNVAAEPDSDTRSGVSGLTGLTNAEAAAEIPDVDLTAIRKKESRRFTLDAIRRSVFTLFNADLIGIAIIMAFLESPLGVLGSVLVIIINVGLNAFQQTFARSQMMKLAEAVRPEIVVVRDSVLKTVSLTQVVVGDLVVAGPGDEFSVAGTVRHSEDLVVDESTIGRSEPRAVARGSALVAGTFVVSGHALYESSEAGIEQQAEREQEGVVVYSSDYTALQAILRGVLRVMFAAVVIFAVLVLLDSVITAREIVSDEYRDAFSIVFGVAPTSLFLILVVVYAMGLLRIADHGALAYNAGSVETLGGVSVICASRSSLVAGLSVSLRMIKDPKGETVISRPRTRRVLGDLVHTVGAVDKTSTMLRDAVEGDERRTSDKVGLLTVRGWSAAAFDAEDIRGTVVLGEPDVLASHLAWMPDFDVAAEDWFADVLSIGSGEGLVSRALGKLQEWLRPKEEIEEEQEAPEGGAADLAGAALLLAYLPQRVTLVGDAGEPRVPDGLLPLALVDVLEDIRPEAHRTLGGFVDAGIEIKILDSEPVEYVAATVEELGVRLEGQELMSGDDVAAMNDEELAEALASTVALGGLTAAQKTRVLTTLKASGQLVAMLGHSVSDMGAMREASVSVAQLGSDASTMLSADIVLLKESLGALRSVLLTGQRIVNGVLDTFKLYLSQTGSQLLLILALPLLYQGEFPYHPTHGSVISAWTIAIPNMFLATWAAAGMLTARGMRRRLGHFVIPAAICTALLAIVAQNIVFRQPISLEVGQTWVMYALLFAGWFRVLFLQPPTRFWVGGEELRGDKRIWWLMLATVSSYVLVTAVPLFAGWLRIAPMPSAWAYVFALIAAFAWAMVVRTVWRTRALDWGADRMAAPSERKVKARWESS